MKTLYLMESEGIEVRRDGPSLWINRQGKAGQRVPARWVDRVIVTGNVRLDAEVITLFTANHIPVMFLNRAGRLVGVALATGRFPSGQVGPLSRRLEQSLHDPDWRERYRNWLAHCRKGLQKAVLGMVKTGMRERMLASGWKEELFEQVIRGCAPPWARDDLYHAVCTFFEGLFTDLIMGSIRCACLDPATVTLDPGQRFGLVDDLKRTVRPELLRMAIEFVKGLRPEHLPRYYCRSRKEWTVEGWKKLVGFFERERMHLEKIIQRLIHELEALVWEDSYESGLSHCL